MIPSPLLAQAEALISALRARGGRVVTAESCTGGLIAGSITEVAGASDVFDRGFVTYSNAAKCEDLDIAEALILKHGAVSAEVAAAMALGALANASATVSIAVTGVAGPGGGTDAKPVGLVYIAVSSGTGAVRVVEKRYGSIGRHDIRLATVLDALVLAQALVLDQTAET